MAEASLVEALNSMATSTMKDQKHAQLAKTGYEPHMLPYETLSPQEASHGIRLGKGEEMQVSRCRGDT